MDAIKIAANNAEEWLLDRLAHHYRNPHDIRDLLRSFAHLSGEITTTSVGVSVRLDAPDTPAHRRALEGLCAELNALRAPYPGTDLPVRTVLPALQKPTISSRILQRQFPCDSLL